MKDSDLNSIISLQEEVLTIYLNHLEALIYRLSFKKKDKIKIEQTIKNLIEEKRELLKKIKEIQS